MVETVVPVMSEEQKTETTAANIIRHAQAVNDPKASYSSQEFNEGMIAALETANLNAKERALREANELGLSNRILATINEGDVPAKDSGGAQQSHKPSDEKLGDQVAHRLEDAKLFSTFAANAFTDNDQKKEFRGTTARDLGAVKELLVAAGPDTAKVANLAILKIDGDYREVEQNHPLKAYQSMSIGEAREILGNDMKEVGLSLNGGPLSGSVSPPTSPKPESGPTQGQSQGTRRP